MNWNASSSVPEVSRRSRFVTWGKNVQFFQESMRVPRIVPSRVALEAERKFDDENGDPGKCELRQLGIEPVFRDLTKSRSSVITVFFIQVGHVTFFPIKKPSKHSVASNSTTSERILPEIILHDTDVFAGCFLYGPDDVRHSFEVAARF